MTSRPITFTCQATLSLKPEEIARLATGFDETWDFERDGDRTHVIRSFEMYPKSARTKPLLWLISFVLKRAIARHLEQMAQEA